MLVKGIRWRIGDGSQVKVRGDPWVGGNDNLKLSMPLINGLDDFLVFRLINGDGRGWNVDLLNELLLP